MKKGSNTVDLVLLTGQFFFRTSVANSKIKAAKNQPAIDKNLKAEISMNISK